MTQSSSFHVLAYYHFVSIENPHEEVEKHKQFLGERQATGRIYISEQGINGQMSGEPSAVAEYMEWMHEDPRFSSMEFKVHDYHEQAFPRLTIKYRTQLVALDQEVDLSSRGKPVSSAEWKAMLESDEDYLILDVRNKYEWEIGHFEGAVLPPCETFREFPAFAQQLRQENDPSKTKVMMYCTGGIRCELFSALLHRHGFEQVYQLQGGVIKYGLEQGADHWRGKLFVFDDRLAVPLDEQNSTVVASCHHCKALSDTYYNCANMDCNELFVCCPNCFTKFKGCCGLSCMEGGRLRPHQSYDGHKPFRKKHFYENVS